MADVNNDQRRQRYATVRLAHGKQLSGEFAETYYTSARIQDQIANVTATGVGVMTT